MHAACLKCEAVGIRFECEMRFKHTAVLLPLFLFMKRCCCCCCSISLRSISKEHWLYNCDKLYAINRFIDERKSMNMNSQVYNRMKKKTEFDENTWCTLKLRSRKTISVNFALPPILSKTHKQIETDKKYGRMCLLLFLFYSKSIKKMVPVDEINGFFSITFT